MIQPRSKRQQPHPAEHQPGQSSRRWFDAHLDLAMLAELGRDLHAEPGDARGRQLPVAVTLPSLRAGGVRACLITVFTEPVTPGDPAAETASFAFPDGDDDKAYVAGMRQLKLYHAWRDAGLVTFMTPRGTPQPALRDDAVLTGVLMENASPITRPEDLEQWVRDGVVAIGLTWTRANRYACGNACEGDDDRGLSDAGRALVAEMDRLCMVHDASHLSDRSLEDLLGATDRPVIASHSNCRSVLLRGGPAPGPGHDQRHLSDEAIREIARRGGLIGLNLYSKFLARGIAGRRATVDEAVAHVEHVSELAGTRACAALGSDMDGGFPADRLPEGIDRPAHLELLAAALSRRGWSDAEIDGFAWGNWARFWNVG